MKKTLLLIAWVGCLTACAPQTSVRPLDHPEPTVAGDVQDTNASTLAVGDEALRDIQNWYNDTRGNCGSPTEPAFLCTGVMLRATESNPAFYPWNPNPSSSGVSFSWLRADMNFASLVYAYQSGFIFYPKSTGASGTENISVLCVFPMDSDTNRRSVEGCGPHSSVGSSSRACDEQNIVTADQWLAHFNALAASNKYIGQCGWNERRGQPSTAGRFMQAVDARSRMPATYWRIQNELRLGKWAQNARVPIRAFFWVPGNSNALANARYDQTRYRDFFGVTAPIIRVSLPTVQGGRASFAYVAADQAVINGVGSAPVPDQGLNSAPLEPQFVDFESLAPARGLGYLEVEGIVFSSSDKGLAVVAGAAREAMVGRRLVASGIVEIRPASVVPLIEFDYRANRGVTIECLRDGVDPARDDLPASSSTRHYVCGGGAITQVVVRGARAADAVEIDNVRTR